MTEPQADFSQLPGALLGAVFGCLPPRDVCAARGACKALRNGKPLWRRIAWQQMSDAIFAASVHMCVPGYAREVEYNDHLTDEGFALWSCGVTDAGLVHVASLASLEKLNFSA